MTFVARRAEIEPVLTLAASLLALLLSRRRHRSRWPLHVQLFNPHTYYT